ncbi:cadherin-like domain-containing protein [Aliarcobacter cryaerophilus]|uniref:cadherin-like domain-containing protein n=1 Tax=Aliarcobacter cryaerophilus TaxID=28198 RepID=UPI0021B1BF9D|nr:cadherin-like domain-containing protein [Aliarcobacter cryaerophilus]MCT7445314.1 cadherin-like domain-containing protein [Aliarcobacter cryaerophilus]MCT7480126.1 cadherin-like domain-containing protein [Aliarcobacter cryaerophilus]MCT7489242.1 cadherin-like domain-containing protein [Aliarcobacter cryaerophilus]
MATQEYQIGITAFSSKEEYDKYVEISNYIDKFCSTADILNTVSSTNKYVEMTMNFCDNHGDVTDVVKVFSPILKEGQTEREIFAQIGSKIVRLGVESAFEYAGEKAGITVGTGLVAAGIVGTAGIGTIPAYIMGTATGGATYLGYKFVGVGVGHYAEKYSYEKFIDLYDKYIDNPSNNNIDLGNNQNITPDEVKSVVFLDTSTNEKTVYSVDTNNNNNLTPEYKTNITTGATVLLKAGETISHVAVGTNFSTKELLQFNGLSETHAKYLPVGYEVQIPKNVKNLQGGYGNVKLYEGHDGSLTYHIPADKDGSIKVVKLDKYGNVLQDDFDTSGTTILPEIEVDGNDPTTMETSSGNYDESIEEQKEKRKQEEEEYRKTHSQEEIDIYWGGVINTAVGQIGSIVIANNNFSNIEKLAVNTSFATLGDFAEYKYGGSENGFNTADTALDNLKGAVVSFALASFFAKNDNIADILGMDGTFIGGLADFSLTFTTGYSLGVLANSGFSLDALSNSFSSTVDLSGNYVASSFATAFVGAVGGYLGNAFANKVMGWDTKEEALGASIGSAVGTIAISAMQAPLIGSLLAMGPVGWIAAVFVVFGGSAIGNFIGGIVGGLFGGSKPPPPTAQAEYEFDEETQSYNLISSGSADGGNQQAMINIGKAFANHLENMFNIPGGQLVNSEFLPDININQRDKTVKINGEKGTFDTVNDMIGNLLIQNIPFINVENGDEYILRAINRTNDKFLETDIHDKSRANLDELYENISLASDYSKYKNETMVIVDSNGNLISDKNQLQTINTQFQTIQNIQDEKEKEKALKEFMEDYKFVTQKEYVDKLLKDNNPNKQAEIDHWKKVFAIAEELQLDTHHYSEDFNKLNSEIAKYNYEQSELKGELVDIDYDKYMEQLTSKILNIYEGKALSESDNPKNISKDEAALILKEIGFNFLEHEMQNNPNNSMFGMTSISKDKEVILSFERLKELFEIAGLDNPFENIKPIEDAFSFVGKSLNDLQFKIEDGKLYIKTFDKDLDSTEADELSRTFVVDNWTKWDKTNSHIELPDGTRVNLQALLEIIGVKEGVGFVDVNEAFLDILEENETISSYLKEYNSNNVYVGTSKGDTIKSYFEDNLIVTGSGKNTIVTGIGDDIVFAHNGTNDINLGSGNDTVSYELNDSAIYASLESGRSSQNDTLKDVENLHGSKYNDILEGDDKDNTLFGGSGDDILIGLGGADTLDGGEGVDLASYETSSAVEINLKHNYAEGGEATGDKFVNIEGIKGSKEADTIVGDNNSNLIYANDGDDRVSGNDGDDIIFGGKGNDYIKGDAGNDTLYGEDGDDILIGGAGDDILVGGTGKNMLYGDSGKDTVLYKGKSEDYEILFINENTLFVKSKDGKTLDTLRNIEELAFDDAVFEIDYENKTLIKKVVFENQEEDEKEDETLEDRQNNQAATIATAVMIGTVAAASTQESSTDEMNYLSDDPASLNSLESLNNNIVVTSPTQDTTLFDTTQKNNSNNQMFDNTTDSNEEGEDKIYQIQNNQENSESESESKKSETITSEILANIKEQTNIEIKSELTITVENDIEDDSLDPLIAPQIILEQILIKEDNNLYGIKISDLNNITTTLEVVFIGLPDGFSLSAGEKRADGNWYLSQNDLKDLYMIPQEHNAYDFNLTIKAIVSDTNGRTTISTLTQTIVIEAVVDTPILEVENSQGSEDTQISLNIKSLLVDKDGSEDLKIKIENIPDEAVLNHGIKDSNGVWHLLPYELNSLTITPPLHDAKDFTIKVTAYSTEDENGDTTFISKEVFIEVNAIADEVILNTLQSLNNRDDLIEATEDASIMLLDISSTFIDKDGSESVHYIVEGLPDGTTLNQGVEISKGTWKILPEELQDLGIFLKQNSDEDFRIKVSAVTTEEENGHQQYTSKYIDVTIDSQADYANLTVSNTKGLQNDFIPLKIDTSLNDTDGSEILEIIIEDIPTGAILNNGVQKDGKWYLTIDDLTNLQIRPPFNSTTSFELKVKAVTTEQKNGNSVETVGYIKVNVDPIPSSANITVKPVSVLEDTVCKLDIKVDESNLKPKESIYLELTLPKDFSLNQGERLSNGNWKLRVDQLDNLILKTLPNYAGSLTINITSVIVEENGKLIRSEIPVKLPIDIEAVADEATLEVNNIDTNENSLVYLNINSKLTDLDGSETLQLRISGVPENSVLNVGKKEGSIWIVEEKDIKTIAMLNPKGVFGNINLDIEAVSTDSNGDKSIVSKSMIVNLNKINNEIFKVESSFDSQNPKFYINNLQVNSDTNQGDFLEYSGTNDTIKSGGGSDFIYANGGDDIVYADEESGNINLSFKINSDLHKTDGSEKSIFYIENLPKGFSSNKGYISNGKLVIENNDFDGNITISYPYTKDNTELKIISSVVSTNPTNPYVNNTTLTLNVKATELAGNDYINAGSGNDIVYGQDGDDVILGGDGNDILFGGAGNDYINGGKGADRIDGGAGDDVIVMEAEDFSQNSFITEIVNGGSGFDTVIIQGNKGISFDMGLTNIESFIGGDGNDNIIGSEFSDIIRGGKGADTYYTLDGDDIVYIDGEDIKAKSGNFIDTGDGYDKIYIEDSDGVDFDVADTNAEEIISGSGNDILRNSKNDNVTIYGMDGDDIIFASSGVDILDGGTGNDTLDYSNSNSGVNVNILTNTVSGGYATGDTIRNFENIVGTKYDDNLTGNNKDNIFYAGAGNNIINGMGGVDTVVFEGSLFDYYNGKDKKNIVTNFDGSATVYSSLGVNTLTNINKLQFDDYVVYIDGSKDNNPFAYNDKINGVEDTKLIIDSNTLLDNDFDIEGDSLKIVGVRNAKNGTVSIDTNGQVTFVPYANYNSSTNNQFDKNSALYKGLAGFEYIVEDNEGNQRTAYVDVDIKAVNDAPTIVGYYFNLTSFITGRGRFTINDVDSNVDSIGFKVISSSIGYTNIANRTADANGEFYFDYYGLYYRYGRYDVFSMRNFVVQISDEGDPSTGKNIGSIVTVAGAYVELVIGDPIVIDLDGDGIEIGEYFYETHDATLIGAYKDDAILVWDKDQNGTISSSDETNFLGLSKTAKNDLDVLREVFDTNKDGIFDKNDDEWNNFALWQDKNMDGLVDEDEFTKIANSNILKLNLDSNDNKKVDMPILEYASYTTKDGDEYEIAASYIDTTMTEDKLSQEDILILKEAIVLVEQMASSNNNIDKYEEIELNNSIFDDNLDEEYIA